MPVKKNVDKMDLVEFIEQLKESQDSEELAPTKKGKSTEKKLSLFDHFNHVKGVQNPKYFETLSDADKRTWSNWMILKFFSYNQDYVDIINELQICVNIKPELMYKTLIEIFPKDKSFFKFIKGAAQERFGEELITLVKNHFKINTAEAIDYLVIFFKDSKGKTELSRIISLYGKTEKEIKEILKR